MTMSNEQARTLQQAMFEILHREQQSRFMEVLKEYDERTKRFQSIIDDIKASLPY